jgi:crotonobetainyl-CoA:carnitine CoA-transferase CaiB-like acyl-CoA transferase
MMKSQPLEGLRVLDFSHAYAGPFCSMYLGDLGADVVKVEKPGRGDGCRYMGTKLFEDAPLQPDFYISMNRNKKSLLVDLRDERGAALIHELVPNFDIVIQNFRPGVMDRLGLGFEDLSKLRLGLIYLSISAFGFEGPMKDKPANDMIMQAASGLMATTGEEDGGPVRIQSPITDFTTGLYAMTGVLTALAARDRYPQGQHVKVSMLDSCIGLLSNDVPKVVTRGMRLQKVGRRHQFTAPYEAFVCGDGKYLMVGAITQKFWVILANVLGCTELIDDPRFLTNGDRVKNRDELADLLRGKFAEKTRDEWAKILDECDVPNTPVYEPHEMLVLPQVAINGTVVRIGEEEGKPIDVVRYPARCDAWKEDAPVKFPPAMGVDTKAVLEEFKVDKEKVKKLFEERVIGDETFVKEPKK